MTTAGVAVPVAATDRVSEVLARDEALVEVFARYAPHFERLRNRAMRRVLARLVTVEQAARTAHVPADALVRELNRALGIEAPPSEPAVPPAVRAAQRPASAHVVELDVRDDLRAGREPFSRIMRAVGALQQGDVLRLRALFEPVPLFAVLEKRGFAHESQQHAPDDWSAWFWQALPGAAAREPGAATGEAAACAAGEAAVCLDVRGLTPPEPLVRTLAALETLPGGHTLVQINDRVPQFLLPMLVERGFACDVDDSCADRVLVRIRHAG